MRAAALTPLPQAPPVVCGVINLWGDVLPVCDLRYRLGLERQPLRAHDHFLIVQTPQRRLVLLAESVEGVVTCTAAQLTAAPQLAPGLTLVAGILKLGDDLAVIHELEALLQAEEVVALDEALRLAAQLPTASASGENRAEGEV